jgi:ribosome biogenesis GTPase
VTVATVLSGTGGVWSVRQHDDGVVRQAALRGRLKQGQALKLAVGDEVHIEPDSRGETWAITEILPRRSQLTRRAPGGAYGARTLAANLDQVVVVLAVARPEPHARMLDRFLVVAEANGIPPRVVANKVDLAGEAQARALFGEYERIGYPLHFTSTRAAHGLDALHDALRGRVSVLTGPSGVGKSSLLNAMYPGLELRVGELSESVNKGRHTTVGALAHPLPDGGFVVDTPGLREIGLWGIPSASLDTCFPEFRPALGTCRFADCRHVAEPECAVRELLSTGDVSEARYESYRTLLDEALAAEREARP